MQYFNAFGAGGMESLESRRLLSVSIGSASLDHGILIVEGTRHDDVIQIAEYFGRGQKLTLDILCNDRSLGAFRTRDVRGVQVLGGNGNDSMSVGRRATSVVELVGDRAVGSPIFFRAPGTVIGFTRDSAL